jgi:hypothetical protein
VFVTEREREERGRERESRKKWSRQKGRKRERNTYLHQRRKFSNNCK